jgi:hypothetical protein
VPIPSAESIESFKRYLEDTRLDPLRNKRLTAPPFLQLDLESESTPRNSVKYFLTKMDFGREISRSFSGQDLLYADTDGGDAWGRRKQIGMVIAEREDPLGSMGGSIGALELLLSKACS